MRSVAERDSQRGNKRTQLEAKLSGGLGTATRRSQPRVSQVFALCICSNRVCVVCCVLSVVCVCVCLLCVVGCVLSVGCVSVGCSLLNMLVALLLPLLPLPHSHTLRHRCLFSSRRHWHV